MGEAQGAETAYPKTLSAACGDTCPVTHAVPGGGHEARGKMVEKGMGEAELKGKRSFSVQDLITLYTETHYFFSTNIPAVENTSLKTHSYTSVYFQNTKPSCYSDSKMYIRMYCTYPVNIS